MVSIEGYADAFIFILVSARVFEDKVKWRSVGNSALMAVLFAGLLSPLRVGDDIW